MGLIPEFFYFHMIRVFNETINIIDNVNRNNEMVDVF